MEKPKNKRIRKNNKAAFLKAFRRTCDITLSAKMVGIGRKSHYEWLKTDPKYAAAFEDAIPDAATELESYLFKWARRGFFEPYFYRGKACYATRKRVMCVLADETQCFQDELPEGAVVVGRKTVVTADGKQLGVWRRSPQIALALAAAWMPKRYGTQIRVTGEDGKALIPDEIRVIFGHPDQVVQVASEARPFDHDPVLPATTGVPVPEVPL